jgi:hypothetical protein
LVNLKVAEIILPFIVVIMVYAFLRSQGGKGADISFKMAPSSTPEGKRVRISLGFALVGLVGASFVAAFGSGLTRQQEYFSLTIFIVIAGGGFISAMVGNKKN